MQERSNSRQRSSWLGGVLVGALKKLGCVLLLVISAAAAAHSSNNVGAPGPGRPYSSQIERWSPHIREASARFGIPEEWIRRVMRAESGGRTMLDGRPIASRAGALGLMQLMPGTWAEMRAKHALGRDPHDPRDNILAGTAYLRAMYDRFGHPGLFAAYNAGPQRYTDHLTSGRWLPPETIAYVAAVGGIPRHRSAAPQKKSRRSGVFVTLVDARQADVEAALPHAPGNTLFVRLNTASPASAPSK